MRLRTCSFVLLLCLLGLTSCNDNYLDETVITDLNEDVIFGDSTYATGFLTDIYSAVGFDTEPNRFGNGGLQVACDEAEFHQSSSISTGMAFATGTINPVTVTSDAWSTCYTKIRACNKFLKLVDKTPMVESARSRYKAECRFLRAWYYFILLRHYGGVPLIGDTCYTATDRMKSTRDTYADCVKYILDETNTVINENVLAQRTTGKRNGRISEASCRGLVSRLTLYAASPLFNGSGFGTDSTRLLLGYPDYNKERWHDAYVAARNCITMGGDYRLYENHINDSGQSEPGWGYYAIYFPEDFYKNTTYGDITYPYGAYQGVILEKKAAAGVGINQMMCPVSCGGGGSGGYIYAGLADAYPMKDGKPINESKYAYDPYRPNVNRDPRYANIVTYDSCMQRSGLDANHIVYTRTGDVTTQDEVHNGTPTGLFTRKFVNRNGAGNYFVGSPMVRGLIRYAEILLNYAEAVNEYYGPDFSETLNDSVMSPYVALKLIRRRAGIEAGDDGMYGLKTGMTQDEMREAIRLERRIELAYEGHRFFDERRWMIAEDVENQPMTGIEITVTKTSRSWKEFVVRNHVFRKAMYFFPIPYNETVKTPELIQNPYYD